MGAILLNFSAGAQAPQRILALYQKLRAGAAIRSRCGGVDVPFDPCCESLARLVCGPV